MLYVYCIKHKCESFGWKPGLCLYLYEQQASQPSSGGSAQTAGKDET